MTHLAVSAAPDLMARMEATWPAAARHRVGPWTIREGRGGGQRVSAATLAGDAGGADPAEAEAEAAMRAWGQVPIFLLTGRDAGLDARLAARGYVRHDPVVLMASPCAAMAVRGTDADGTVAHWPPDAVACALWDAGGIGPARRAVMDRARGPKAVVLARHADGPAGVAFVALDRGTAVLHALEVSPAFRRQGVGARIMARAARWAAMRGATRIALAVTEENLAARSLYARLGMTHAGGYHYRIPAPAGAACA